MVFNPVLNGKRGIQCLEKLLKYDYSVFCIVSFLSYLMPLIFYIETFRSSLVAGQSPLKMGKGVSKLLSKKTPVRILLLGLDSAGTQAEQLFVPATLNFDFLILVFAIVASFPSQGKTTILYKMKLGEYVQTMPTIGAKMQI